METSPRLRGQRRADYAALAGRRSQLPSTLPRSPGCLENQDDQTDVSVVLGKQDRPGVPEGRSRPGLHGHRSISLVDVLQQEALYVDVLESRLSERLRELARRAAASRDEHRRQAHLLQVRAERDLKRRRVREHAPSVPAKRLASESRSRVTASPGVPDSPAREGLAMSVNADSIGAADREATIVPVEERMSQELKYGLPVGQDESPKLECLQASIQRLEEAVLNAHDPKLDAQRRVEDQILREAAEIQQRNLESAKARLPKQPEPPRSKTHQDYFRESIIWLATDYREQFKWKATARSRIHRALAKYHEERSIREAREANALEASRRRYARLLSREVRKFWESLFRIMFSQRLEEDERKQKQQRQTRLDALIQQTEQYAQALAEELAPLDVQDASPSLSASVLEQVEATGTDTHPRLRKGAAATNRANAPEPATDTSDTEQEDDLPNRWRQAGSLEVQEVLRSLHPKSEPTLSQERCTDATPSNANGFRQAPQGATQTLSSTAPVVLEADSISQTPGKERLEKDLMLNIGEPQPSAELPITNALTQTSSRSLTREVPSASSHPQTASSFQDTGVQVDTNPLFRGHLRPYQQAGLQWLIALYEKGLNGMLADEMGLGKTVQTIALLAWLAVAKQDWGPHLVVVPTSVVMNWDIEFKKFAPGLKVLCYFGSPQERATKRRGWTKPNAYHVCITSYHMVVQDATIFRRQRWSYLVLDEAQHIKNFQSQKWQTLLTFHSRHRLLLTGTPLQNTLIELWSLLHFLMPQVFRSHSEFKEWFQEPIETLVEADTDVHDSLVQRLHRVLRPFVLRRLKRDVERGLPPKTEQIVWCTLSKRQRELYDDFLSRASTREKLASGNYLSVMNVLIQLRKVCNHPDLFAGRPIQEPYASQQPLVLHVPRCVRSETLCLRDAAVPLLVDESLDKLDAARIRALSAASRLLWETEASASSAKAETALGPWFRLQTAIEAEELKERQALRLVSCTRFVAGPLIGCTQRRLTQVAFRRVPVIHPGSVLERLVDEVMVQATRFAMVTQRVWAPVPQLVSIAAFLYQRLERRALPPSMEYLLRLCRPLASRQQLLFPDAQLLQWDCGKLQRLAVLLRDLERQGHRVLIFTQMARMLDILEQFLCLHRFSYIRMDGSTRTDWRLRLCERFNTDPRYLVFLSTTRSGGVGLNLTGADTVLFYDSDWNPTIDAQAQDRCHRIGQERPVRIYRLVSQGTVEEHILRRAMQKQRLERLVMAQGLFTTEVLQRVHPLELVTDAAMRPTPYPNAHGELIECGLTEQEYERLESVVLEADDEEERLMRKAMELAASANATLDEADFSESRSRGPSLDATNWYPVWRTAWRIAGALGGPMAALEDACVSPKPSSNGWSSNNPEQVVSGDIDQDAAPPLVYPALPARGTWEQKNEQGGLNTAPMMMMIYCPPVETPEDLVLDPEAGTEDATFFIHAYARVARSAAPTPRQTAQLQELQQFASDAQRKDPTKSAETIPSVTAPKASKAGMTPVASRPVIVANKSNAISEPAGVSTISLGLERRALLNLQPWIRNRLQWSAEEDLTLLRAWQCYGANGRLLADVLQAQPGVRLGLLPHRSGNEIQERLQYLLANKITEPAAWFRWRGSMQTAALPNMRKHHQRSLQLAQRRVLGMRARLDARRLLASTTTVAAEPEAKKGAASSEQALVPLLNKRGTRATPDAQTDPLALSRSPNEGRLPGARDEHDAMMLQPSPSSSLDPRSLSTLQPSSSAHHRPGVKLEEELRRRRPFRRHPATLGRLRGFERHSNQNTNPNTSSLHRTSFE